MAGSRTQIDVFMWELGKGYQSGRNNLWANGDVVSSLTCFSLKPFRNYTSGRSQTLILRRPFHRTPDGRAVCIESTP